MKLTVAVLMGGPSAEAEVSRVSAGEVMKALNKADHTGKLIELDATTAQALLKLQPQVVFPALHGPPGEDGTVQGFLEILGLPYVGSGVHGSAAAMDKSIAKAIFRASELPVADDLVIPGNTDIATADAQIRAALGDRVVIKPLSQGSAIGITPVANGGDLTEAIRQALGYDSGILVETYILGHEITVGVLDLAGEPARPLPVIEIRTASNEWYDYTNRYTKGKSKHIIPAPLGESMNEQLQEIALKAHAALGLRDLSRADFIVTDDEEIVLLEVNSLPGMTPTSLFPDGAKALGMSFPELMDALVLSAYQRANAPDLN